ncbi:hypothetical protein [Streptomyces sp. NPDC054784]
MSHHRNSRRTKRHSIVAGAVAAVLLPLGVAGTAAADAPTGGSQHTAAGSAPGAAASTPKVVTKVEKFYRSYIAALGAGDTAKADSLRKSNLTKSLRTQLAEWERQHSADGVTRAQNVPAGADVAYDGSGMGHSWTIVTLKWNGGSDVTKLHVQSDLDTLRISDLKTFD